MFSKYLIKNHKWPYFLAAVLFLISNLYYFPPIFAQTTNLSVVMAINPSAFGSAPLAGLDMTASVSGTATGPINYYFYCNAANDSSTTVIPGYPHSVIGTNSATITTPAGICDSVYANVGTYLAKVIVERGGFAAEERVTVGVFNPVPSVDLRIRLLGTTDWSDWIIDVPYNSVAEIRWTFSGAPSCTMSGDWTGTKTAPGQEPTGNLTEGKTYIYTLECNTSSGLLTDTVLVRVAPPTLFASLSATPNSGTAPLAGVILRADVTGGTAIGTINYTFYCNRSDTGTNITSGWAHKLDGTNLLTLSSPSTACNSVYANSGTYIAKVIIERGGVASESRTPVTVSPPPPPIVDLSADSISIPYNTSTMLRWTTTYATSCTPALGPANWTSSGNKTIPTGNWSTGNLTGPSNYTYRLTCTGLGGTTSDSVNVLVDGPPLPPVVNIWANDSNGPITVAYGTRVLLRWETGYYGADSCEGWSDFSSWSGSKNPGGSQEYTESLFGPEQYTFIITCYNAGGSGSDRVIVNVLARPPTINSFQANPTSVNCGSASELSWSATNDVAGTATVCAITGGLTRTGLPPVGSISTGNITSTQSYTLTCANSGGPVTRPPLTVTINDVPAPTISSFSATPANLSYTNSGSQLSWSATNNSCAPTTCAITGGGLNRIGLSYQGSITTPSITSSQTYTLTCLNTGGQVTRSVTVTVGAAPAPTINSFTAIPANIIYGASVTLTWNSTNATSCEASSTSDKWIGTRLPNGSSIVYNLTSNESFTLTCTGPGGTTARSVNVTVGAAPPVTVNISAKPAGESVYSTGDIEVNCGTAVDIRWVVTGAVGCWAWGDWREGAVSATGGTYRTQSLREDSYYEIECENSEYNSQTDSVSVTVRECEAGGPIIFDNPIQQGDLGGILDSVSGLIKMIAIGLAGIMIIVSGIIILTSIDDRERLNKGKKMLKWSLIGLAIALASSFIIGFIQEIINHQ